MSHESQVFGVARADAACTAHHATQGRLIARTSSRIAAQRRSAEISCAPSKISRVCRTPRRKSSRESARAPRSRKNRSWQPASRWIRLMPRSACAWVAAIRTGSSSNQPPQISSITRPLSVANGSNASPGRSGSGCIRTRGAKGREQHRRVFPVRNRHLLPERAPRAPEEVAQLAGRNGEQRLVAALEQRIAGVRCQGAEHVRSQHRQDECAVAPRGVTGDSATLANRERRVALVDESDDLIAEAVHVRARAGRVQELRGPARRPRIDEDDERRVTGSPSGLPCRSSERTTSRSR